MGLFDRSRSPKRAHFEQEAMQHIDSLYATALRLTRSTSDAEDLVQDTLLKAYRFYDKFEAGTNLKAWLLKIETNTFINRYRRKARERKVFDGASAEPVGEGVMSRAAMRGLTHAVDDAQRGLLAREIQDALDSLPHEHRLMVVLADIEELSYKEIADIVGCPIGTVMSRLHRARKSMQQRLLGQAVAMGIVDDGVELAEAAAPQVDSEAAVTTPVSLESYRVKKAAVR